MPSQGEDFGAVGGERAKRYTLEGSGGLQVKLTNLGARVTELHVPDRHGRLRDVVLGCDSAPQYLLQNAYLGATVGRVANRIDHARFELSGRQYHVYPSDAPHHLHGGHTGWDRALWQATPAVDQRSIRFTHLSPAGDEGYPGAVYAFVSYELFGENELRIRMSAVSQERTLINLAHHGYWNLAGHDSGSILDHELTLFADAYTPGAPVPLGEVLPTRETPFDFSHAKPVARDLAAVGGYDHNFIVRGPSNELRAVAVLRDPKSGRVMTLSSDQPGVQFYSGNFLDGAIAGKNTSYAKHAGLCLETQKFPNAINVPAWRSQVILEPGAHYSHTMVYRFSID